MQLQHVSGFKAWFKPQRDTLVSDPLFSSFSKHRDFIVHQGMLKPYSQAHVGTTRDKRSLKIAVPFPADVFADSDEIISHFVETCADNDFLFGLASGYDDDSQFPCILRTWRISPFPGEEVRTICIRAWKLTGDLLSSTSRWLGHEPTRYDLLPCLPSHEDSATMLRVYEKTIFDGVLRSGSTRKL